MVVLIKDTLAAGRKKEKKVSLVEKAEKDGVRLKLGHMKSHLEQRDSIIISYVCQTNCSTSE